VRYLYFNDKDCRWDIGEKHLYNLTRRAMYVNVTLRRVYVTIVALEKRKVLHILSVCL